ncbi:MAG: oligosaccharide flippase family protein [Chitinophagales bacterium]
METTSYKQIIRSTGITGIAQSIIIILKIIGNKFIAVLLGPVGIGYMGLLQSTIDLINNISGLGLGSSAVRDIAVASKSEDAHKISSTILVLKRLCIVTGIAGTIFTFICAPFLSRWAFQNNDHINDFRYLSVALFITQIAIGQQAILQGTRRLKEMAISSITGTAAGLILTVPLYFIYGKDAIVPAILISAGIYLFTSWYFSRKVKTIKTQLSINETLSSAKGMITLGFATMLSGLFILISIYQLRLLINQELGMFYVGIFQAGWGIEAIYLQMLFQAMSRDYYPRLSAISNSPTEMNKLVNEQLHISILIAAPIISIMILVSPLLIQLMYSPEFYSAASLLQWLLMGTLLKIFAWPVAFVLPALRSTRIYLLTEAFASLGIWLIARLLIDRFGIEAVGIAYMLNYILYCTLVFFIARRLISLKFDKFTFTVISVSAVFIAITFILRRNEYFSTLSIIGATSASCLLIAWSVFHLNRVAGIKGIILRKFRSVGKSDN